MIIGDCLYCDGTTQVPHPSAGETVTCFTCKGFKVLRANGLAFKSAQSAKRGGRSCRTCEGSGTYTFAMTNLCTRCHYDSGKMVLSANPGDILPETINRCTHVSGLNSDDFEFVVERLGDKEINRAASYLGVRGAISTCIDYGRAFDYETSENELVSSAKRELLTTQWLNIIDSESREIAKVVRIVVTRNGYVTTV